MSEPATTATDVLIAGAGPTGLALACGLLSHGVPVRVVDRASGPATTSRANFLHARGSEVLDRLGALDGLPEEAGTALLITTYAGDRPLLRLRFGDPGMRTAAPPMVISQARIEAALRERLTELGGNVEWDTAVVDAAQDGPGVTVTLGDGTSVRARWLAGCDGSAGTVRALAGIDFPGVRLSERFLLADARVDWDLDRSGTHGWTHPEGLFAAMPMPDPGGAGGLWRLFAYDPGGHGDRPSEREIIDRFRELLPERTGHRDARVHDAVWTSLFRVHRRLADGYRSGRVLLAGDAAHVHAPFGGQGMLTGLGDAENLAWKLALVLQGAAREPLLDTYQAERRPLAADVLRATTAVTRMNIADGPVGRFLRDRLLVPVVNRPPAQRWATYSASQLWVSYRRGPLGGSRFGPRPRPGDRVADMACVDAHGTGTRLYRELGGRWALLTPPRDPGTAAEVSGRWLGRRLVTLRPDGGETAGETWLVRPDGHLMWRGRPEAAGLERRLEGALRRGRVRR